MCPTSAMSCRGHPVGGSRPPPADRLLRYGCPADLQKCNSPRIRGTYPDQTSFANLPTRPGFPAISASKHHRLAEMQLTQIPVHPPDTTTGLRDRRGGLVRGLARSPFTHHSSALAGSPHVPWRAFSEGFCARSHQPTACSDVAVLPTSLQGTARELRGICPDQTLLAPLPTTPRFPAISALKQHPLPC